jgi:chaperonin GroEL
MSKPTKDQREIAQVGTISANNDETIGNHHCRSHE